MRNLLIAIAVILVPPVPEIPLHTDGQPTAPTCIEYCEAA